MGLEEVKACADVFRIFGGRNLEWREGRWELKLEIIKVKKWQKMGKLSIFYMRGVGGISVMQYQYNCVICKSGIRMATARK